MRRYFKGIVEVTGKTEPVIEYVAADEENFMNEEHLMEELWDYIETRGYGLFGDAIAELENTSEHTVSLDEVIEQVLAQLDYSIEEISFEEFSKIPKNSVVTIL